MAYLQPYQSYLRNAAGEHEMAVDGSGGPPKRFWWTPPHLFEVHTAIFTLSVPEKFDIPPTIPPIGTALVATDIHGNVLFDWADGEGILGAFDAATVIGPPSAIIPSSDKDTPTIYVFSWHSHVQCGRPILLGGGRGDAVQCIVHDQLDRVLDSFHILIGGTMHWPDRESFRKHHA
jgi:hypothetical protein